LRELEKGDLPTDFLFGRKREGGILASIKKKGGEKKEIRKRHPPLQRG